MIIGAHSVISSANPDADRAFLRDALRLPSVDDGGYLIFGLPPAEMSVHPADKNDPQQLFLLCDDVKAFVADMAKRNIACGPVKDEGWGLVTQVTLPGGGTLGVYQPRHARPSAMRARPSAAKPSKRVLVKRRGRAPRARAKKKAR